MVGLRDGGCATRVAPATRTGTVTFTRYLVGMNGQTIRAAYSQWPRYNRVLTEVVGVLTPAQLAIRPSRDTWTIESLSEEITRPDFGPDWVHTRGAVIQRVYSHDMWHAGQVSQTLGINGLSGLDVWG